MGWTGERRRPRVKSIGDKIAPRSTSKTIEKEERP
nr:MAG TPA: hypothetical protein [Caudoviricetes sp.]